MDIQPKKRWWQRWWFIAAVLLVVSQTYPLLDFPQVWDRFCDFSELPVTREEYLAAISEAAKRRPTSDSPSRVGIRPSTAVEAGIFRSISTINETEADPLRRHILAAAVARAYGFRLTHLSHLKRPDRNQMFVFYEIHWTQVGNYIHPIFRLGPGHSRLSTQWNQENATLLDVRETSSDIISGFKTARTAFIGPSCPDRYLSSVTMYR